LFIFGYHKLISPRIVGIEPKKVISREKCKPTLVEKQRSEKLFIPSGLKLPSTDSLKNLRSLRQQFSAEVGFYSKQRSKPSLGVEEEGDDQSISTSSSHSSSHRSLVDTHPHHSPQETPNLRPGLIPEKWFKPRIHSQYETLSNTTGEEEEEYSIQSSIASITSSPVNALKLEEKECQTEDLLPPSVAPPPLSVPVPQQTLPPQQSPQQLPSHEDCCDTDDEDDPLPTQTAPHTQTIPTQQQRYSYEEKWLRPKIHSHSPSSSCASSMSSLPLLDHEKENQQQQSSLSSLRSHDSAPAASPARRSHHSEEDDAHQSVSQPKPRRPHPSSCSVLTPHDVNQQNHRKQSSSSPSPSEPFAPPISHCCRHSPSQPCLPAPPPAPLSSAFATGSGYSKPAKSSLQSQSRGSAMGYAPPRDTLDLSNLSFEVNLLLPALSSLHFVSPHCCLSICR
jgi:hypothetical protein